jgi:hypothetical protein
MMNENFKNCPVGIAATAIGMKGMNPLFHY